MSYYIYAQYKGSGRFKPLKKDCSPACHLKDAITFEHLVHAYLFVLMNGDKDYRYQIRSEKCKHIEIKILWVKADD